MNIFTETFNIVLYRPLFNILILLYEYFPGHDFGIAIIVLTVIIRLLLYPLMAQNIRNQRALTAMQPKLKDIQERFKDDQEEQAREILNLYKEHNISPFSAFVPLLIQLPLLLALFSVFQKGLVPDNLTGLYGFVPHPGVINYTFLGILNLGSASVWLAVIAAVLQFIQFKTLNVTPKENKEKKKTKKADYISGLAQRQMPYFLSGFTFIILLRLPAALGLYWITTSIFSIIQQYMLQNHDEPKPN
jgi:YidC/Oxa1 family membrane protein insertase